LLEAQYRAGCCGSADTAFSAALTAVLIKVAVQGIDAGLTTLFRTLTVAVVLALQLGPVTGVAALDKLSVVLVALLAAALLGEQLGLKAWLGVGLMAIGAALVAWA